MISHPSNFGLCSKTKKITGILFSRQNQTVISARSQERPWVLGVAKCPFISGRSQPAAGLQNFSRPDIHTHTHTRTHRLELEGPLIVSVF